MKQSAEARVLVCTRTYPGGWAKDVDEKTALRALRREWPHHLSDYGHAIYDVEPETYIDQLGRFVHPVGKPPKLVREVEGKKKIKKVQA
jgi:hypothetical protein